VAWVWLDRLRRRRLASFAPDRGQLRRVAALIVVEPAGRPRSPIAVSLNNRAVFDRVVAQIDRPPSGMAGLEAGFQAQHLEQ
jgi:hypothetical protein